MYLIKEIKTSNLLIQIYSLNSDLLVDVDSSLFEGKDDDQIKDMVFNQMGADQVDISSSPYRGDPESRNLRSYALI